MGSHSFSPRSSLGVQFCAASAQQLRSWSASAGMVQSLKGEPNIKYSTRNPELEFYTMLSDTLGPILNHKHVLRAAAEPALRELHERLESVTGGPVTLFPQVSWVLVEPTDGAQGARSYVTLLRDNDHKNIMSIFFEDKNRKPQKDRFTVLRGMVGAYPNALFRVSTEQLAAFIDEVLAQKDEDSYDRLRDRYGIRRTDPTFWQFSDQLYADMEAQSGIRAGRPDYSRLENR